MQREFHEQEAVNVEVIREQLNDEKERVVAALKQQHATILQRLQDEIEAVKKRGVLIAKRLVISIPHAAADFD